MLGVVLHVYGIIVEARPAGAESPVGPITLGGVKIDLEQEDVCSPRRVDLVYAPLAAWYNATGRAALRAKHGPLPAAADAFSPVAHAQRGRHGVPRRPGRAPPAF